MADHPYPPDMRRLMAGFPTGVAIVTSIGPDRLPKGMTCTSLASVALDPPTLLVCLRRGSPTLEAVLDSGSFAVNLLHERARYAAELFASGDAERFHRTAWIPVAGGGPHLVQAAHTIADCAVAHTHPVGDHTVVLAEVVAVSTLSASEPLLYGMRRYGVWADADHPAPVPAPGSVPAPLRATAAP